MAAIERKRLDDPDTRLTYPNGGGETVRVGALVIGRATLRPGWRWSRDLRPMVGTEQCELRHFHIVLSGRLAVQLAGEDPQEFGPGEVLDVPPGHDAWVVGDEPTVVLDVSGNSDRFGIPAPSRAVVATILMTDIVGSTETAGRLGDPAWRQLLAHHHRVVRAQLEKYHGREIDTTGDGFLATFESAVAALHCARAIRDALAELDIAIRAGLHTGEVEYDGADVGGIAVHLAARVMAAARPGEILASSLTQALAAGRGFRFEDRGSHRLKGFDEPVDLAALV